MGRRERAAAGRETRTELRPRGPRPRGDPQGGIRAASGGGGEVSS
jgi:hypothetical protein